jgi:hypothetical protein
MARASHGLPKASLWNTIPYLFMLRGGPPAEWGACDYLLPFWTPHAVCMTLKVANEETFEGGFKMAPIQNG